MVEAVCLPCSSLLVSTSEGSGDDGLTGTIPIEEQLEGSSPKTTR